MTYRLTLQGIEDFKACANQRTLFEQLYPDGFDVSAEELSAAAAGGLDVLWLLGRLPEFGERGRAAFCVETLDPHAGDLDAPFVDALALVKNEEEDAREIQKRRLIAQKAIIKKLPYRYRTATVRGVRISPYLLDRFEMSSQVLLEAACVLLLSRYPGRTPAGAPMTAARGTIAAGTAEATVYAKIAEYLNG